MWGSEPGLQVFAGGELLLAGDALRVVRQAMGAAQRAMTRDGLPLPPLARAVMAALDLAEVRARSVSSDCGSSEVVDGGEGGLFALLDPVSTKEAAQMLQKTPRNVTDLCKRRSLRSARQIGGQWFIERSEVADRSGV